MEQQRTVRFSPQFRRWLLIALLIMVALAVIGIGSRILAYRKLRSGVAQNNIPAVAVIQAALGPATEELILPGNVQGWHTAAIYARTNGYTVHWMVDIGAHVKAGDLLAVISTPEIDEQLRQTEANLKTAIFNHQLARRTALRWRHLLKTKSVSKQETDEKVTAVKATGAIVAANRANRDRLRKLVSFERVIAPFTGVITSRAVDIGRLINAGSSAAPPLFRITQANPLRIYVRTPQYFSARIKSDLTAELYFREHPEKMYPAKLLNTAEAIEGTTRTLLVQFAASNPNDELFPGSYAEVHLKLPGSATAVRLPVTTLIFRAQGMQVATVSAGHVAELKSIAIGRDFGDSVEVVSGLAPGEMVITHPPSTIASGQKVRVVSESK